jgi:hypothetical protein
MLLRLFIDILILFGLLVIQWWIVLPIAIFFTFRFKNYYELIIYGFVLDSLYAVPMPYLYNIELIFSIVCTTIYLIVELLKPQLRGIIG